MGTRFKSRVTPPHVAAARQAEPSKPSETAVSAGVPNTASTLAGERVTRSRGALARPTPESLLEKATQAKSPSVRAKYAQRGLTQVGALSNTTRMMLLRQLYLSQMEARCFQDALSAATEMIACNVMPDVARQDAARACLGLGDPDAALDHLRIASRVGPAARRAFHLWTLGTVLYLNGRPRDAIGALERALRWGTVDKPLYAAQSALARLALGEKVPDLAELREALTDAPCGRGYGQFVLGELAFAQGDRAAAREYLSEFVRRTTGGRVALAVSLEGEVRRAQELLRGLHRKRAVGD